MNISEISYQINENAKAKGFWDNGIDIPEKLMLIVSEISEAMEADRINKRADWTYDGPPIIQPEQLDDEKFKELFESWVKNTLEDELADAAIRIFDLAYQMGINLEWHIAQKVRYNSMRPHMHGGKKY